MIYSRNTAIAVDENTDFLKDTKLMDFNQFTGSMLEQSVYISSLIEGAYTDLFTQIGIDELAVLESTGSMVVYEAEDANNDKTPEKTEAGKKVGERIVEWFKHIWTAIKTALTKMLTTLDAKARETATKFGNKVKERWNASKDKMDKNKEFGKMHTSIEGSNSLESVVKKIGDNAVSFASSLNGSEISDEDILKKVLDGTKITGVSNISDLKGKFKEVYMGKDEIVKATDINDKFIDNLLSAIGVRGGDASYKIAIKAAYDAQKKEINTLIAKVKKEKAEGYKNIVSQAKKAVSITNTSMSAALDLVKKQFVESVMMLASINAALSRGESNSNKEFKKLKKDIKSGKVQDPMSDQEDVFYESASLSESINNLFAW